MSNITLERLPGSPGCFICDNNGSNPRSLHLKLMWNPDAEQVEVAFQPDATWCGYDNVVHGGLVASVMDEAMAWAIKRKSGQWAFTADFQVRYKKPVAPGQSYLVKAGCGELGGRKIEAEAEVLNQDGKVIAQAKGVFLPSGGQARPRVTEG